MGKQQALTIADGLVDGRGLRCAVVVDTALCRRKVKVLCEPHDLSSVPVVARS